MLCLHLLEFIWPQSRRALWDIYEIDPDDTDRVRRGDGTSGIRRRGLHAPSLLPR